MTTGAAHPHRPPVRPYVQQPSHLGPSSPRAATVATRPQRAQGSGGRLLALHRLHTAAPSGRQENLRVPNRFVLRTVVLFRA